MLSGLERALEIVWCGIGFRGSLRPNNTCVLLCGPCGTHNGCLDLRVEQPRYACRGCLDTRAECHLGIRVECCIGVRALRENVKYCDK